MTDALARHRITVAEWQEMGRRGIFEDDDRLELLDGEIIELAPIGDRHALCVDRLTRQLSAIVGDRAVVRVQNPIRLDGYSEPQPDVSLVIGPVDRYERLPVPEEVLLVIEVADATLRRDREKARLYARAGIGECWIVDLTAGTVTTLRDPQGTTYREERRHDAAGTLEIAALPGPRLPAAAVLGPERRAPITAAGTAAGTAERRT